MSLRKGSLLIGRYRIHEWNDADLNFHAEASKHDGEWFVEVGTKAATFRTYQDAVDWVLDNYRLTKAGLDSWEGPAVLIAALGGWDWAELTHDERQAFLKMASENARRQEATHA